MHCWASLPRSRRPPPPPCRSTTPGVPRKPYYYKTGIAFLAWLNGYQAGFQMIGGLHSGRDLNHLVKLFTLANTAGLLLHPELAAQRMAGFLNTAGVPSAVLEGADA